MKSVIPFAELAEAALEVRLHFLRALVLGGMAASIPSNAATRSSSLEACR